MIPLTDILHTDYRKERFFLMKYDFTSIMDRHEMDSISIDGLGSIPGFSPDPPKDGFDIIPMWIADMNFPTVPTIPEAIVRRAAHPAYGYFQITDAYYDAIIQWHLKRNGVSGLTKSHIGYENGVLGGVLSALNILCSRGGSVLLHSPTYTGFTECLKNNGYSIIHSPLFQDSEGIWRMNFEDMEQKIIKYHIHAVVFCSPHNPCGRVWEREELEQAMALFQKYDVYVISDEIWSDLILDGHHHIPIQNISEDARERTLAFYAPSKTFNLAGLVGSYHIVYNTWLRSRLEKESSLSHYNSINVLSMHALIAAYQPEGHEWLDELLQVLTKNVDFACHYIQTHFDGISVSRPQGTYMLFLNCTEWCSRHGKTIYELEKAGWDVGVMWQDGTMFHGACHIRMNLALPLSRVQEAFERLDRYVFHSF